MSLLPPAARGAFPAKPKWARWPHSSVGAARFAVRPRSPYRPSPFSRRATRPLPPRPPLPPRNHDKDDQFNHAPPSPSSLCQYLRELGGLSAAARRGRGSPALSSVPELVGKRLALQKTIRGHKCGRPAAPPPAHSLPSAPL